MPSGGGHAEGREPASVAAREHTCGTAGVARHVWHGMWFAAPRFFSLAARTTQESRRA